MNNELKWEVIIDTEKLFRLHKAGWEIEVTAGTVWVPWDVKVWNNKWSFRARPPKPKMKQVKMKCYLVYGELRWRDEKLSILDGWLRQPNLDKIAEVPE